MTRPGVRIAVMFATLALDGVLALALWVAVGLESIAAGGIRGNLVTRGEFTGWLVTFACWAALMAVPLVIGVRRGRPELVLVQTVVAAVVVVMAIVPTLWSGWHDIHQPTGSTPIPTTSTFACTGHVNNPCPGG